MHACHECRDLVEREGWVKTRLAGLSVRGTAAPVPLKGSLLVRGPVGRAGRRWPTTRRWPARGRRRSRSRRLGGGAAGAAVMGVLALGAAPANAPGAIARPASESFGDNLVNAITAVIDRDFRLGPQPTDARPGGHGHRRTLAP